MYQFFSFTAGRIPLTCAARQWAVLALLVFGGAPLACGQSMLKDKQYLAQVTGTLHQVRSFHFDKADSILAHVPARWRSHPSFFILDAVKDYYKFLPITLHPPQYQRYKRSLERAVDLADARQEKDPNDVDAIFFSMMAYTMLGRQASEDGDELKAVNYARKAFGNLKKGFDLARVFPDFHFSNGLYNYYRVRYPEHHPAYKPFLMFFQEGNVETGLHDLEIASEKGLFSKTDALYFLAGIHMHYESKPAKGLVFAQRLVHQYPSNPTFRLFLAEALILNKHLSDVPAHLAYVNRFNSMYLKASASALEGWYHEAQGDRTKAATAYADGMAKADRMGKMIDNARSICLAGQARQMAAQGERQKTKALYRKVLDISNNTYLRTEAHQYLKRRDDDGNKVPRSQYKIIRTKPTSSAQHKELLQDLE